jgi:hypothetical protein
MSLTEMRTHVRVMGTAAALEFNFEGDSLYAVSFNPVSLPAPAGDALFDRLGRFYTGRLGKPRVSDGQDDPYFVKSRTWAAPGCEVGVTNSYAGPMRQVGWGYQVRANLRTDDR